MTGFPVEDLRIGFWRWCIEQLTTERESVRAIAVSEEPKVPKLGKTVGKDVNEEAPDELVGFESHRLFAVAVFAVFPLEGYFAVLEG